jgi:hypothetical protein
MSKINPFMRDWSDRIALVKAGDTLEARDLVEQLRFHLACSVVGKYPLSPLFADFLSEALAAGLRGESINKALGLARKGRGNEWEWQAKALSVRFVQDLMGEGLTLDVACGRASESIGIYVAERAAAFASGDLDTINRYLHERGQMWASFKDKTPSEWDCRRWYTQMTKTSKRMTKTSK